MKRETKTATLKIRLEPSHKREITRFALIHRLDMSDLVRLGVQRVMDRAEKPEPLIINGG